MSRNFATGVHLQMKEHQEPNADPSQAFIILDEHFKTKEDALIYLEGVLKCNHLSGTKITLTIE